MAWGAVSPNRAIDPRTCTHGSSGVISTDQYHGYIVESGLDVAIQPAAIDGPHDDFLVFVDLLKKSPDLRDRYNELKRKHHGKPMNS